MIIDVRKFWPTIQRKSVQMVIKQELDQLHDKLLAVRSSCIDRFNEDAVMHEALAQVEELRKLIKKL